MCGHGIPIRLPSWQMHFHEDELSSQKTSTVLISCPSQLQTSYSEELICLVDKESEQTKQTAIFIVISALTKIYFKLFILQLLVIARLILFFKFLNLFGSSYGVALVFEENNDKINSQMLLIALDQHGIISSTFLKNALVRRKPRNSTSNELVSIYSVSPCTYLSRVVTDVREFILSLIRIVFEHFTPWFMLQNWICMNSLAVL